MAEKKYSGSWLIVRGMRAVSGVAEEQSTCGVI